jgi:hypothetical protein
MSETDTKRAEIAETPPLDYELDISLAPDEITPDYWSECAVLDDEEPVPFAARPMFSAVETGLLAIVTLIGVALLVWGASS